MHDWAMAANGRLSAHELVLVQVLLGNVVLGNLPRSDASLIGVGCVLDAADDTGLEGLTLFKQFLDALRIRQLGSRESFGVTRLAARLRAQAARR